MGHGTVTRSSGQSLARVRVVEPGIIRHESQAVSYGPGCPCRKDKPDSGHKHYGSGNQHGLGCVPVPHIPEQKESDTEEHHDEADLEGRENASHYVWHEWGCACAGRDWSRFKESPACLCFHVRSQLLAGAEFIDEAGVDFALHLEGAAPAAALKDELGDENEGAKDGDDHDHGNHFVD